MYNTFIIQIFQNMFKCRTVLIIFIIVHCIKIQKTISQKPNIDNRRHDVYIAGFFPFGKGVENSETGRGVMPSVKLALDHVNEHSGVLRNYRLHMWWNDTECNAAVGVKAFFDMMHSGPHKLMLFGAACTHVTDPIAKASKHWHLTQLSYADTHPMFTSESFPNFFRIVPSENAFNPPRLSLLRKFNWTRVGTIFQNEPRYSLAHNRLVADLDTMNAEVAETASFGNEVFLALRKLKEKDVRIILGNFDESWARRIFCEAYRLEMYGKKYQWIIMGTYSEGWWNVDEDYKNCTKEEIHTALEQAILTDLLPLSTTGEITVSGITADEYKFEYDSRRGNEYSRFHGYTYDGIWAVALAIQHVAHKIKLYRRNQTVSDFRYRDPLWERLFLEALGNTSFEGVTGPVRFYGNERKASILLKQFQEGTEIKVGEYNAATDHLDLTLGAPMKWLGRYPPKDRTLEIIEHSQVNKTVYAIFASCAALGILMATIFLIINIKYRNQRYIKMSSPQLNNLIIIGCMLTYTSVVFLGLDSGLSSVGAFPYICTARAWTLMAGFSLAFGAMFSKTWRVHSIFTDVKLNKKVIKDYQLFMVVGVLLFIDFIIMTTWQVADPFYRETKKMEPYPHPSSDDIIIIQENEYCQSERMTIFVVSIYIYKGLLMILGAFLAWETRHVSIPALNDSRHVGLSVYNVVIICICGAAVALVLSDRRDAAFAIIAIFIIFCTTTTLCLVFVPKLVELKRNPGGSIDKRIRATLRPMSKTRRDSNVTELEHRLKEVKSYNSKYRKTLLERESELQMLIRSLGPDASDILDNKSGSSKCLSVPLMKKEVTSTTDPSDTTSLCSISSIKHDTLGSKKKFQPTTPVSCNSESSPKHDRLVPILTSSHTKSQEFHHSSESPQHKSSQRTTPTTSHQTPTKSVEFLNQDICITQNIVQNSITNNNKYQQDTKRKATVQTTDSTTETVTNNTVRRESVVGDRPKMPTPKADKKCLTDQNNQTFERTKYIPNDNDQWQQQHQQPPSATHEQQHSINQQTRRSSMRPDNIVAQENINNVCHRRVSMPVNNKQQIPKEVQRQKDFKPKKLDFSGHVVAKSELWDTGNQHRCSQKHKITRVNIASQPDVTSVPQDSDVSSITQTIMQRSVSEKNRHASARSSSGGGSGGSGGGSGTIYNNNNKPITVEHQQQYTSSIKQQPPKLTSLYNQECNKYGYVQSTPNVAACLRSGSSSNTNTLNSRHISSHHHHTNKNKYENNSIYSASSESELLDGAILPIFQKLLTERKKSQQQMNLSYGQSCPNISIKCDIVEYL